MDKTMVEWIGKPPSGVLMKIQSQAGAPCPEFIGPFGPPPRLKIRVAAPPVDGGANETLVAFLSKKLGIPKSSIEIIRGLSSKSKDLGCAGITPENARAALVEPL
jgi:uncharacterized protein